MTKYPVCALGNVIPRSDSDMFCEDIFDNESMFYTELAEFETSLSAVKYVSLDRYRYAW